MFRRIPLRITLTAALLGLVAAFAHADKVVLVGIDEYEFLPQARLHGCESDAQLVKTMLVGQYGFKESDIVVLNSADASKSNILGALDRAIAGLASNERFVYYQSSHGTQGPDGTARLLTHTSDNSYEGDISREELQARMDAAKAKSPNITLLLDACFSEGALTKGNGPKGVAKFYRRPGGNAMAKNARDNMIQARGAERVVVPGNVTPDTFQTGALAINQYASSRATETSRIGSFPTGPQSVFTRYLVDVLKTKPASWTAAIAGVTGGVAQWSKDEQHPVYAGPGAGAIFTVSTATPNRSVPISGIGEFYALDNVNAAKIELTFRIGDVPAGPNTPVTRKTTPSGQFDPAASLCKISATAGVDGFLFLLDRDQSDQIQLMLPDTLTGSTDEILGRAAISAGDTRSAGDLQFNLSGPENIKAVLFTSRAEAAKFVEKARASNLLKGGVKRTGLKIFERVSVPLASLYTADLRFDVSG